MLRVNNLGHDSQILPKGSPWRTQTFDAEATQGSVQQHIFRDWPRDAHIARSLLPHILFWAKNSWFPQRHAATYQI